MSAARTVVPIAGATLPVDTLGRAVARPAHLGHGPLQLPLPVLHAARDVPRALPLPEIGRAAVSSRRSCASRGCSRRSACASCASRAASRCCARTCPISSASSRRSTASTTSRSRPTACCSRKYAAELKANGLKRVTVSLDSLDQEVFARMSGGFGGVRQVLDGIEAAQQAGLAPIKINAVVAARRQRSHGARPRRALPRQRHHRALHRVHGRRQPQSLEPGARGAVARARWRASARAGRCTRSRRTIEAKSPSVTPSTTVRARSASSPR